MDISFIIIAVLVLITSALLVFCLTESKGENTKHARKNASPDTEYAKQPETDADKSTHQSNQTTA